MSSQIPAKKNTPYTFAVGLTSQSNAKVFQSSPTLAAGDVKISKDGGAEASVASLPTAAGKLVTVSLSADEMNADRVVVIFSDQAGDQWCDLVCEIHTASKQFDDMSDFDESVDQVIVATNNDKDDYTISGTLDTLDDLTIPTPAEILAEIDANSTVLAAIVADTGELQTDIADGGRIDLLIDSLVSSVAGTLSEPTGIADAPAAPTLKQALALLYIALRNQAKVTTTKRQYYNDAGVVILEALINDASSEFTQGELDDPA